jgi:hypothetical protein
VLGCLCVELRDAATRCVACVVDEEVDWRVVLDALYNARNTIVRGKIRDEHFHLDVVITSQRFSYCLKPIGTAGYEYE